MRLKNLRWIAAAALWLLNCAPVQRAPSHTMSLDGQYGTAEYVHTGCEDTVRRSHRQGGGRLRYRYEGEGIVAGGEMWGLLGRRQADGPQLETGPRYTIGGASAHIGYHGRGAGSEFGLGLFGSSHDDLAGYPFLRFLFGKLESVWFELALGPDDPSLNVNLLGAGVGFRADKLRFNARIAAADRFVVDSNDATRPPQEHELLLGDLHPMFTFKMDYQFNGSGIIAALAAGQSVVGRLGYAWRF